MARLFGKLRLLTDQELEDLHQGALRLLERVGVRVYHRGAREYLRAAGCRIEGEGPLVRFPAIVVESALETMREDFLRPERQGLSQSNRYTRSHYWRRPDGIDHGFTVNSGGFCVFVLDLEGERRPATMRDVHDSLKLVNALDQIDWSGLPCSDQDTPHPLRPVRMAAELVKYTRKLGGIEAWTPLDIECLQELAVIVRGSAAAALESPCLVGYGESRSPLALDENMAEVFIQYVRRGLPQSLDGMPSAGTTTPASGAAALAVGLAETLAGLVLGYAVRREAILSLDCTGGYCDMQGLLFPYAAPDRMPFTGAWVQLLRERYGVSAGVHGGKTDACSAGFQAGMEKAYSTLFPVLCGAAGIGTIGQLEQGRTASHLQLVLDCEVVRAVRRLLRGFEVNADTLALELVERIGPEGNFIAEEHTAENFSREFWLSPLTECLSWESHGKKQVRGMEALAAETAREILARPLEPVLDDHQARAVDQVVEYAAHRLGLRA